MDIDVKACRIRQQRLQDQMQQRELDWTIVVQIEHVQYFTGTRFDWTFHPMLAISAAGHAILVTPQRHMSAQHAADEVHPYAAKWHSTLRNDQPIAAADVLRHVLPNLTANQRVGVEFSTFPHQLDWPCQLIDVEADLYELRRRKAPDELAKIRQAIAATEAMYERAREIIRPGVNELDVFNELQAVAVTTLGEPLTGTGNDYRCGARGGSPRNRTAQAGELYILDLGPAFRGYFSDNARTIAVSDPSTVQLEAWQFVIEVFDLVESEVRPGASARSIFEAAQALLDRCPHGIFNHHLGHGIGMFPHEAPHLNPNWDDTFQIGDVFTAEPGLYAPALSAGMRIENDYVVTENGVERLTNFPLELKL